MATCGENCSNDWPKTMMTGGCLLVAFAPDRATGNDDDDESLLFWITPPSVFSFKRLFIFRENITLLEINNCTMLI